MLDCKLPIDNVNHYITTGQTIGLRFEYLLESTSTTSADVTFFTPQISSAADLNQPTTTTSTNTFEVVKVPKSTAPTCNFLIDQPNITLDTLKLSDIENLTAGTAVTGVQKTINISVSCAATALSASATFAPQFSPTKSAVLTGNCHYIQYAHVCFLTKPVCFHAKTSKAVTPGPVSSSIMVTFSIL